MNDLKFAFRQLLKNPGFTAVAALTLLIGAGLLIRSFREVLNVKTGYQPQGLLVMNLSFASPRFSTNENKNAFVKDLLERLEGLPGVHAAGFSFGLPLAKGIPAIGRSSATGRGGSGDYYSSAIAVGR